MIDDEIKFKKMEGYPLGKQGGNKNEMSGRNYLNSSPVKEFIKFLVRGRHKHLSSKMVVNAMDTTKGISL